MRLLQKLRICNKISPRRIREPTCIAAGKDSHPYHKVLVEGVPVIKENTCCWLLCKVIGSMDLGREVIFAAEITAGSDVSIGTPMTYAFYRSEMHGISPVGSPTYIPPENTFDKSSGESFVCKNGKLVLPKKDINAYLLRKMEK